MSAAPAAPPAAWAELDRRPGAGRLLSRIGTFCLVELQRLKHDRSELMTRAIQPVLWLLIFATTFSRIRAIPTGDVPYLDYLAPGSWPSPRCSSRSSTASRSSGNGTPASSPSC
jgi:ABC-2 type transport system permease protein